MALHAVVPYILQQMKFKNHNIVLPEQFRRPGMGVMFGIKEFFEDQLEVIDLRCMFLEPSDFKALRYIGEDGTLKSGESKLTNSLILNGNQIKLVILDEFDSAMPEVKELLEKIIQHVETYNSYIFFVRK